MGIAIIKMYQIFLISGWIKNEKFVISSIVFNKEIIKDFEQENLFITGRKNLKVHRFNNM